jgi:hypothetical protein
MNMRRSATRDILIYELGTAELRSTWIRVRYMRDKERTLARQKQRETRGKRSAWRKFFRNRRTTVATQADLCPAKKRANKELNHLRKLEARTTHVEAARQALPLRRAASFGSVPVAYGTSDDGMRPVPNPRRRTKAPPRRIGCVSQATKVEQAVRDSRS